MFLIFFSHLHFFIFLMFGLFPHSQNHTCSLPRNGRSKSLFYLYLFISITSLIYYITFSISFSFKVWGIHQNNYFFYTLLLLLCYLTWGEFHYSNGRLPCLEHKPKYVFSLVLVRFGQISSYKFSGWCLRKCMVLFWV